MRKKQTLSNTKKIRNSLYNIKNKLDKNFTNNNNDDFIENVRDLFNIENSNKLDKKIINDDDDFIENIRTSIN